MLNYLTILMVKNQKAKLQLFTIAALQPTNLEN